MAKRLRKTLSLAERVDVLKKIDSKESQTSIAVVFGINQSQVSRIARDKQKILKEWRGSANPDRKRRRTGKADVIEEALLYWYRRSSDRTLPVTGPLLMGKAEELARDLGRTDFRATSGWLERWKARNSISFRQVPRGGKRLARTRAAERWLEEVFPDLVKDYASKDVFVADETSLRWRAVPEVASETNTRGVSGVMRWAKDRVTLLLCANLDGSEKPLPLVVGTSKNPRCFKNIEKLPLPYEANKHACVTAELWNGWLAKMDESMRLQDRNILVLCDSHAGVRGEHGALSNVKLVCPPSDGTAHAGIAESFSGHYRALALAREHRRASNVRDGSGGPTVTPRARFLNLLDSLLLQKEAWMCLTPATIASCYKNAGFAVQPLLGGEAAGGRGGDDDDDHPGVDPPDGAMRDTVGATGAETHDVNGCGRDATGSETVAFATPRAYTFSGALESLAYIRGFLETSCCGVCNEYFALQTVIYDSQTETAQASVTKSFTRPEPS